MCKNKPVFCLDNEEVLNVDLLPGLMKRYPSKITFLNWLKTRYSSGSNTLARMLRGKVFGQKDRTKIDLTTFSLSLSDSYWLRKADSSLTFEQISPYHNKFWDGTEEYIGGSIPTLYTSGFLNKYWDNSNTLIKFNSEEQIKLEYECCRLCEVCRIPVAKSKIQVAGNKPAILSFNFTSTELMLETAEMSGIINEENITDELIINTFGYSGLSMIVVDAIFGNADRHVGNFGFLRSTDTGEYVSMAPLYDFDHALDSRAESDIMVKDAIKYISNLLDLNEKETTIQIVKTIKSETEVNEFSKRAKFILDNIR